MAYIKPEKPLEDSSSNYFFPITTIDQIIIDDNTRLSDCSVFVDNTLSHVLLSSKWINVDGQYTQSITINGLTELYNVHIHIAYTGDYTTDLSINDGASNITYAQQTNDVITFYCLKNKPEVHIPIEIEVKI